MSQVFRARGAGSRGVSDAERDVPGPDIQCSNGFRSRSRVRRARGAGPSSAGSGVQIRPKVTPMVTPMVTPSKKGVTGLAVTPCF